MIQELSVIIPCYNEHERIFLSLNRLIDFCDEVCKKYEIILVDDGSIDFTGEDLEKEYSNYDNIIIIKNQTNRGKGFSVKRGMLKAKYQYVIYMDADLSTPLPCLLNLYRIMRQKDRDIVFGSRRMLTSFILTKQSYLRQVMGKIFPLFVNIILGLRFKDTQCGFKLFNKRCIKNIFLNQRIDRFAFDVEILYIAQKLDYRIEEVGVSWFNDKRSKVNIIKDTKDMFESLFKIKQIHKNLGKNL